MMADRVTFRIEAETFETLRAEAARQRRSVGNMLNVILAEWAGTVKKTRTKKKET